MLLQRSYPKKYPLRNETFLCPSVFLPISIKDAGSNYAKNPERNRKIVALYKKGTAGTALAKKIGLSVPQTYLIINDALSKKRKK